MAPDGVVLAIGITGARVSDDGKPSTIGMQAAPSSTLESAFSNEGGSVRFADLVAQAGPDFNGGSLNFAGMIEWTCGEAASWRRRERGRAARVSHGPR